MKMFKDMTKKEKMELLEAYLDGKTLQVWTIIGNSNVPGRWKSVDYFPNSAEYGLCWRVAPPKPKELWVNEYRRQRRGHISKEEAISWATSGAERVAVHYVEVIEGEEG